MPLWFMGLEHSVNWRVGGSMVAWLLRLNVIEALLGGIAATALVFG
jgi:hypothetical protein